ncbi:MAG TPA: glycosyltransferase family 4 protein [Chryseosolibacter sp.]
MKNYPIYIQHHSERPFRGVKSFLQKKVDRHVRGYFFASDVMADEWVRTRLIRNRQKVHEVFEATSSFPGSDREGLNTKPFSFIWVGRLDANKDPLTMIDGFVEFLKHEPAAELYMIFKTQELFADVQKQITGIAKSIHLVGNVPHHEMPSWYNKANFIVSTSLYEVGAVAVVEAMSAGCIPILADIPALAKITSNGRVGLLYPSQQPELLAHALLRASKLNIKAERQKLNQFYEEQLSPSAIARELTAAINVSQKESSSV